MLTQNRPEKDTAENTRFNYHVSAVRIRSEHCMGYIKGRWSSLRGLRIAINEPSHIQFATLWITACITLHNFAMRHEAGYDIKTDEFFISGEQIIAEEKRAAAARAEHEAAELGSIRDEALREAARDVELIQGRLKREKIKKALFTYLDDL